MAGGAAEREAGEGEDGARSGSGAAAVVAAAAATASSAAATGGGSISAAAAVGRTPAQLRFEATQRARMEEAAAKAATKSHREKIEGLNKLLEKLPEHNDLFKIQSAGTG